MQEKHCNAAQIVYTSKAKLPLAMSRCCTTKAAVITKISVQNEMHFTNNFR